MSRRKKLRGQPGSKRFTQHDGGFMSVSTKVHMGRVTKTFHAPMSDNVDVAFDIFTSAFREFKKTGKV